MELRLIAHIVPFPVLRHENKNQKAHHQFVVNKQSHIIYFEEMQRGPCFYHSSVLHSEQGKSYFKTKDGIVSTMAYRKPANTHAFTWYGTAKNTFFPPRYLRSHQKTDRTDRWWEHVRSTDDTTKQHTHSSVRKLNANINLSPSHSHVQV
jgi:hypothetical protein